VSEELPGAPNDPMAACAREAIAQLRGRAYFADRVDWPKVSREVLDAIDDGADLAGALRPVWRALGDGHSHLRSARQFVDRVEPTTLPAGRRLSAGVGYLTLPGFAADYRDTAALDYVEAVWSLLREPAAGWVVDLRGNAGGSVVPMLAAIGPLLGPGGWLTYRQRGGDTQTYRYAAGTLRINDYELLSAPDAPPDTPALPVALLTDRRTASAAEAAVVACRGRLHTRGFGTSTAGMSTGNVSHRLPDGSLLAIAASVAVDRHGHCYAGAVEPDAGGGLPEAHAWLTTRNPC